MTPSDMTIITPIAFRSRSITIMSTGSFGRPKRSRLKANTWEIELSAFTSAIIASKAGRLVLLPLTASSR
ncbi:MAG: hypothetical protein DWI03_01905 [Planctomycetota bacterium]|nr:MAG: hypothetical protein DWI03_01905 [Planctomycetota bacterium]